MKKMNEKISIPIKKNLSVRSKLKNINISVFLAETTIIYCEYLIPFK